MRAYRWLPPIPPEHGAKTLLLVALVTPLSMSGGPGVPVRSGTVSTYGVFAGIAAGSLLFREAIRQTRLATSPAKRRYGSIALLEAALLVAFVGGLGALEGSGWTFLLLLPVGGALDAWRTRENGSKPLRKAGRGVLAIGVLVPLGLRLLGFTDPAMLVAGYGLFVGYHLLAVLRVGAAVDAWQSVPAIALFVPIAAFGLVGLGYSMVGLGIGAPIVFAVSGLRSGQLELSGSAPSLKRLGQTEAILSLVFVLAGPVLLP